MSPVNQMPVVSSGGHGGTNPLTPSPATTAPSTTRPGTRARVSGGGAAASTIAPSDVTSTEGSGRNLASRASFTVALRRSNMSGLRRYASVSGLKPVLPTTVKVHVTTFTRSCCGLSASFPAMSVKSGGTTTSACATTGCVSVPVVPP